MNYLNTLKERCLLKDLNNFLLYQKKLKKTVNIGIATSKGTKNAKITQKFILFINSPPKFSPRRSPGTKLFYYKITSQLRSLLSKL